MFVLHFLSHSYALSPFKVLVAVVIDKPGRQTERRINIYHLQWFL